MGKTIIQSVLFSMGVIVIYFGIQIGWGMYQTMNYVPDVIKAYGTVGYLENKVSFGVIGSPTDWAGQLALLFVAGVAAFFALRWIFRTIKR